MHEGGRARPTAGARTCAGVRVYECVCAGVHSPRPTGPLLFSYGGYVEKDWPPNARTANPVSC